MRWIALVAVVIVAATAARAAEWINPAGGSFHDPGNWKWGLVPLPGEDVVFAIAGEYTVTFGGPSESIQTGIVTVSCGKVHFAVYGHPWKAASLEVSGWEGRGTHVVISQGGIGGLSGASISNAMLELDDGALWIEYGAGLHLTDADLILRNTSVIYAGGESSSKISGTVTAQIDDGSLLQVSSVGGDAVVEFTGAGQVVAAESVHLLGHTRLSGGIEMTVGVFPGGGEFGGLEVTGAGSSLYSPFLQASELLVFDGGWVSAWYVSSPGVWIVHGAGSELAVDGIGKDLEVVVMGGGVLRLKKGGEAVLSPLTVIGPGRVECESSLEVKTLKLIDGGEVVCPDLYVESGAKGEGHFVGGVRFSNNLEPGWPLGKITVDGSLGIYDEFVVEIAGTKSWQFDSIECTGDAEVYGSGFEARVIGNYVPKLGHTFPVLTAGHLEWYAESTMPDLPGWMELYPHFSSKGITLEVVCYADCDRADGKPVLDIADFICFQTLFATGSLDADCDLSAWLSVDDFICFQTKFAAGCG